MGKKKTTEQFIIDAKNVHGDKYDYSLVNYINNKTKVKIICGEHGVFKQRLDVHINRNDGCPKCVGKNKTNNIFILESNKVHNGRYDYSLVEYKNSQTKVKIICEEHGVFKQTPNSHISGQGCSSCFGNTRKTTTQFILESNITHNNKYDYSLVDYINSSSKVKIICPQHGVFEQSPPSHTKKTRL